MAVVSTIGSSSRNYSTVQAWEDAIPATITDDYTGECYNDTEFSFTGGLLTIDSHTSSGGSWWCTLKCATGHSWSDNANVRTNSRKYNVSNGVGFTSTTTYTNFIVGNQIRFKLDGLQFNVTGDGARVYESGGYGSEILENLIIKFGYAAGGGTLRPYSSSSFTKNCFLYTTNAFGSGMRVGGGATAIGCDVLRCSNISVSGGTGFDTIYSNNILQSCTSFGWSLCANASGWDTTNSKNNATDAASGMPGTTGNKYSVTYSSTTPWTNATSSAPDFIPIAATDLINNGYKDSTNAPNDCTGTARDSTPTIGSWEVTAATGSTGTLARTNAADTSAASGVTTVTGALAKTNANDTVAASGATTVTGSLTKTNTNDTVSASGSVGAAVTGTLSKTNANDTSVASGTVTVTGSLAKTNSNDTVVASGTSTVTGSLSKTNSNDTVVASGAPVVNGSLAKTNANDTSVASGSVGSSVTGTVNKTNANDTVVASGTTSITGTVSKTNSNDTVSASGTSTVKGSLAKTNANDTSVASGTSTVTGSLSKTNSNDTVVASGSTGNPTGAVAYTNANDTVSALGTAQIMQGGGGGKRRKSWDQRERERLETIRLDQEARNRAKYGDMPQALEKVLAHTASPYRRLDPQAVRAYQNSRARDDEEAFALIEALL